MLRAVFSRTRSEERPDIESLVREHYDEVWRFCYRRVGEARAADATQETFVTAQKRIASYQGRSEARTWLFGIALNCCRNLSRKHRLEDTVDWLSPNRPEPRIEGHQDAVIDRLALKRALQSLTPEHREVVLLHEVEGLRYEEIARVQGVPVGTVKSRLHHAFERLRNALADCGEDRR